MVKELKLQNGQSALIDDEDYEKVISRVWCVKEGELKNTLRVYDGSSSENLYLGRFILDSKIGEKIFHLDRNPLNFTKANLKVVGQGEITRKRKGNRNSSSKYKGVWWNKRDCKWESQIGTNGTIIRLGSYQDEEEAALKYNDAALELFGEYAYQNVIGEDNSADTFIIEKVKQKRKQNKTGYKGICEKNGKYQARVWNGSKMIYAGSSSDPVEAAKMHDEKAIELFGDKAVLNFNQMEEK